MKMQCSKCKMPFYDTDIKKAEKLFKYKNVQKAFLNLIHVFRGECF